MYDVTLRNKPCRTDKNRATLPHQTGEATESKHVESADWTLQVWSQETWKILLFKSGGNGLLWLLQLPTQPHTPSLHPALTPKHNYTHTHFKSLLCCFHSQWLQTLLLMAAGSDAVKWWRFIFAKKKEGSRGCTPDEQHLIWNGWFRFVLVWISRSTSIQGWECEVDQMSDTSEGIRGIFRSRGALQIRNWNKRSFEAACRLIEFIAAPFYWTFPTVFFCHKTF